MSYDHGPACSAHGKPQWADVDECGPCDALREDKGRTLVSESPRHTCTPDLFDVTVRCGACASA